MIYRIPRQQAYRCLSYVVVAWLSLFSGSLSAAVAVIVNPSNSLDSITPGQLERIYLRKSKHFNNGLPALPVDQKAGPVRTQFYQMVVNRNERQLKYYWSRMMFSGNARPPAKLVNDRAVVAFVAGNENAVGYISESAVSADVKVILMIDDE